MQGNVLLRNVQQLQPLVLDVERGVVSLLQSQWQTSFWIEVKSPGWCSQFHFCCPLQCWAHGSPPVAWGRTCFVRPPCANTLVSPFLPQIAYIFSVQSPYMPNISKLYLCWPISIFTLQQWRGYTVWISPHKFFYHAQISFWVKDIFVYHFLLQLRLFSVSANFSSRRAREMTLLMSRRRRKSRFLSFFGRNRKWS